MWKTWSLWDKKKAENTGESGIKCAGLNATEKGHNDDIYKR
jgi:hypothetical protein